MEEFVFIHDTGFTIKIHAPGVDPFEIQVSSMELVQEIHHLLMDREETCHRTCFSLQFNGITMDNFAELKTIEGLGDGSVIKVVEEPYTVREARLHIRHVRDLLKSLDPIDAYNGIECNSLSFLSLISSSEFLDKKKSLLRSDSVDCTPPDFIIPGCKDRLISPLLPQIKEQKGPCALKVLTLSGWNPPPGIRKLRGDLTYLYVATLEEKRFHITASTRGFYVNCSTDDEFDPRPADPRSVFHSLIDLLNSISPSFKKNFALILKKRQARHPFERVATPYQVYSWTAPQLEHYIDSIRAEDALSSKLGYEEHIPGQTRDWNEELQTTRELPRKKLPERLLRERAVFKVHSDFVAAATRGAMAVVDGNVMAINPGESTKMQMFIWNNIFFSLGFDVRDHYKDLGGDAAAFVAPNNDLQGVKAYANVDIEGLYTLGTVVIDYRGYRVTAQSIIPGILEREQEQSVVYGSVDFGKTVITHSKYIELLGSAASHLKILPHKVINDKGEEVQLCSSVECKGIIGTDGRHYILDLLRTFPPDTNYLPLPENEYSKELLDMGFPKNFKHKLCCLRQELVDSFFEYRYMMFIKLAAYHLQQLSVNNQSGQPEKTKSNAQIENNNPINSSNNDASELENKTNTTKTDSNESDPQIRPTSKVNGVNSNSASTSKKDKIASTQDAESDSTASNLNCSNCVDLVESTDSKQFDASAISKEAASNSSTDLKLIDYKKIVDNLTTKEKDTTKELVKKAAVAVGSLKEYEFDIRFNTDAYSDGVKHGEEEVDLTKQRQLIKDASAFVVANQIPLFIRECLDNSLSPLDGVTLSDALHSRGINIRYLGFIADLVAKRGQQLAYLHSIIMSEILTRSAKHLFMSYIQGLDMSVNGAAISHFLNCLLLTGQPNYFASNSDPNNPILTYAKFNTNGTGSTGSSSSVTNSSNSGKSAGGRKNKRHNRHHRRLQSESNEWATLTSNLLWSNLRTEMASYYSCSVHCDDIDEMVTKYSLQKVTILRSFCLKTGIQLLLKEYNLTGRVNCFHDDDIVNVFPVVKHIAPKATDAYNFYTTGQTKIQQGYLKDGYELIHEALNLLNNVYGAMHPEIAQCLRMLARLNYIMGDHAEAMAYQQKAVLMSEKVNGIDHPHTITEYAHLALYSFANSQVTIALKLLYRARYLLITVCGEDHPEMAVIDVSTQIHNDLF